MDVSRLQHFHQSAHAAPETEELAYPGPMGKKASRFSPPLAWYTLQNAYSWNSMVVLLIFATAIVILTV